MELKHKLTSLILRQIAVVICLFAFTQANAQSDGIDSARIAVDTMRLTMKHDAKIDTADRFTPAGDTVQASAKKKIDRTTHEFEASSDAIDAIITYSASDSIIFRGSGEAYLYGHAKINYESLELQSDNISLDLENNTVKARGKQDSTGAWIETPIFKDGGDQYESESMDYNFKSKKGLIRGVITQQDDGYITSDMARKNPDNTFLMKDGKYTTCDHFDNPHFYLNLTKAKVMPKKFVVTGPAYFVLLDVPIPLVIPFAYFPFTGSYSSGLLMPTFGEDRRQGFYLRNGGYYFAINDYVDLAVRGDIYTKGSWALNGTSRYKKRYKYNGNLLLSYQVTATGEKEMPDYQEYKDLKIRWTHKQDAKANPFSTFSASVNYSTSSYNKNNNRSYYNATSYSENNKSSSINYAYQFPESPFSLQANMTLNQRQSDSTLAITFPDINLSMTRIYPFQRKKVIGSKKWYEKIYFNWNFDVDNTVTMKQDKLIWSSEIQTANDFFADITASHRVNLGASYNVFKYLLISPSINYSEKWYHKSMDMNWDNDNAKIDTVYNYGMYFRNELSAGVNFNTQLYGFYKPLKWMGGKKIAAIRHLFQPSASFSYAPNTDHFMSPIPGLRNEYFGSYYRPVPGYQDSLRTVDYSHFGGGSPSARSGRGAINLSVSNNLEMKVRSDKDSTGYKKISLIDNLTLNTSYNIFADSLKWSDIGANVRIKLPGNTTFNVNSRWTPYTYQLNDYGAPTRVNVTEMEKNHRLARMTTIGTSLSYTFTNNTFKKKKKNEENPNAPKGESLRSDEFVDTDIDVQELGSPQRLRDKKKTDGNTSPDGYQKINIPWSFSVSANISYGDKKFNKQKLTYDQELNCILTFYGSISLTNNWNFTFNSGYNIVDREISYTTCGITRNLHCWGASLNLVPFGVNQSFNFSIHANSSLLQDLKYEKSSSPNDHPAWY